MVQDDLPLDVTPLLKSLKNMLGTKRFALHASAMIFDHVGFVSPFVVRIKCLLQEIWLRVIDWNDDLPDGFQHKRLTCVVRSSNSCASEERIESTPVFEFSLCEQDTQ
ncbi:hypothetical protein TNCT_484981 [Trichonephila clavata]|uniref:Uncharacterized protein n=1 Tax=Trichonephila clavata TaxID=2740835 RepID=A0A8X6LPJ5_TRICU|nr:hypothetical protein TNCT_484981 [Trichonephila clavata]